MKKIYIQPQTDVCELQVSSQILAGSPGVTAPEQGIGYGGIDDGTNDPEVKENSFEFEW